MKNYFFEFSNTLYMYDIIILTERRYVEKPKDDDVYNWNVYNEDYELCMALESEGLNIARKSWDNQNFDWSTTKYVLFRSTWDYFDRIEEFLGWLETTSKKCKMINAYSTIKWNMDKHYLCELADLGVATPSTYIIEKGDNRALESLMQQYGLNECVIKPCISGAGRHTYHVKADNIAEITSIYDSLIKNEAMILQEFMHSVMDEGEVTIVILGGRYSHAVKKVAKKGEFRVQDDFGGTVHEYTPSESEIELAESIMNKVQPLPAYGRVDLIKDNNGHWVLSELELIEPELWFRFNSNAAQQLASYVAQNIFVEH